MRATAKVTRFAMICAALFAAVTGAGCATAELSQRGAYVQMTNSVDQNACRNLGPVIGKGGGEFGGAWISDEDLIQYATNDLRNKAAEKGATHVVYDNHSMGQTTNNGSGTTSTATIMGIAYWCPPQAPPPANAATAPAGAPALTAPASAAAR